MTQALQSLMQHAERQRDDGVVALLQAEDATSRLQAQTDQLLTYRNDAEARHPAQGGRSASIELLRCHEGFMQRLDQAIAQSRAQLQQAERKVALCHAGLLALQTRVASVRKLLERRTVETQRRDNQLEQRRHDDAGNARRPAIGAPGQHAAFDAGTTRWRLSTRALPLEQPHTHPPTERPR